MENVDTLLELSILNLQKKAKSSVSRLKQMLQLFPKKVGLANETRNIRAMATCQIQKQKQTRGD